MTHTLHREGTPADLQEDYPVLAIRAKGYNEEGNAWRLKRILEIASRYPIVNFGDIKNGSKHTTSLEKILSPDQDPPLVHMVFTSKEDVTGFMRDLKAADLGISVVASGLLQEIFECCKKAGLTPHTVNYSLGIHGRAEKLPPKEIMEMTTMCGHALVSKNLIVKFVEDIKKGKETGRSAAEKLARNCFCGIFNPMRAARILEALSRSLSEYPK